MKEEKQKLKRIWLHCLKELFEEAEKKGKTEIEISARELKCRAKKNYPKYNLDGRYRSTCWTMRKIGKNEDENGKDDSPEYTVKYTNLRAKKEIIDRQLNNIIGNDINESSQVQNINNINKPSLSEVQKYLEKWETLEKYVLQENALNKLFMKTYPYNTNIDDILIKVSSLNDFYSTNIFSTIIVAKHIMKLNIDNKLEKNNYQLVNDIAEISMDNGKTKHLFSFATKYCSHHKPDIFPIYDDYVGKMLVYFNKVYKFYDKTTDLRNYTNFTDILSKFKSCFNLDILSLKEIDRYLWLTGKEYFPKKYYKKKNK